MSKKYLDNSGLSYFWGKINTKLNNKVDSTVEMTDQYNHDYIGTISNNGNSIKIQSNTDYTITDTYLECTDGSVNMMCTNASYTGAIVAMHTQQILMCQYNHDNTYDYCQISSGYTGANIVYYKNGALKGSIDINSSGTSIKGVVTPTSNDMAANKAYVDSAISGKQDTLVSGTNIKTINNQSILGSGNLNISGEITSDVEQKHLYIVNGEPFYYQFYGTTSLDNITVNVGVEVDVIYATYLLITQSVEELQEGYNDTLYAIQHIQIPNEVYESDVLIIVIHNLGSMTCYINPNTKYVTHAVFTNFAQGYSVDFGTNPNELTIYYSATNVVNSYSASTTNTYSANYVNELNAYATTETRIGMWLGKQLYRKVINTGALPNATSKSIAHNISNIDKVVNIRGYAYRDSGQTTITLPFTSTGNNSIVCNREGANVVIIAYSDRRTFTESYVVLEYTKTTD